MLHFVRGDNMDNIAGSFFLGLLCTVGLFTFSFITVVGVKAIIFAVLDSVNKPQPQKEPLKPEKKKQPVVKKRSTPSKPIRSIEIDPDQIDRIFVKKSS